MSLPKELEYVPVMSSLGPNVVNTTVVISPTNGAVFQQSDIIQFDLPQRAFLDPNSLYIRYRFNQTSANGAEIKGTPVYTPFINLQTIMGGSIVENIQGYGQIQNMLTQLTHSAGQKSGLAFPYGLGDYAVTTGATKVGANINGRVCTAAESISMAGPLRCVLSEAERLVPLGLMSGVRVSLTVDTMANIFTSAVAGAGMTLTNVELVYDQIDFGSATEQMVRSMGDKLYIKSASYASSATTLANGTQGTADLLYNLRLSSVKSLFTVFGGTSANSLNKLYDSYDPTSSNGDLSYTIGGLQYPSRPVSTLITKAGAFLELKQAIGGAHSSSTNNFSITEGEFGIVGNAVTTARIPAKFYFGINTEKLSTSTSLLTGISTQDAPIGLRINLGTATQQNYNVNVVALFDALIEVDTVMRSASVKN
tara:strand:+ start:1069 stop:2337 length:1269 start_codon:yes stop_codon:yes gene_type:complete